MRAQFEICTAEHAIENARAVASRWPPAQPLEADLVISADVTYFIEDIEPFLAEIHRAARRRAALLTWTVPPPNVNESLFRLALGVDEAPSPSFRELLPVLWDLGIVPDVRVLGEYFTWPEQLPDRRGIGDQLRARRDRAARR